MTDLDRRQLERAAAQGDPAARAAWLRAVIRGGECRCVRTVEVTEGEVCMCGDPDVHHSQLSNHGFVHACEYYGGDCRCDAETTVETKGPRKDCKACGGWGNRQRHLAELLAYSHDPAALSYYDGDEDRAPTGYLWPFDRWLRGLERWDMAQHRAAGAAGWEAESSLVAEGLGYEPSTALEAYRLWIENPTQGNLDALTRIKAPDWATPRRCPLDGSGQSGYVIRPLAMIARAVDVVGEPTVRHAIC